MAIIIALKLKMSRTEDYKSPLPSPIISRRCFKRCLTMTEKKAIRALVVDDEPLARRGIRSLLKSEGKIEIVGEAADGFEAVSLISSRSPNVVFLDVQMPGLDGFGVIEKIGVHKMPIVIFVTAYDLHALKAFQVHAIDYLLKPITPERLAVALDRARAIIRQPGRKEFDEQVAALLQSMRPPGETLARFVIKSIGKVVIVPVDDVE